MNQINLGTFVSPYREFQIEILPGRVENLRYDHQVVEIIENNLPYNIEACFGGVGGFTKLESGIAYKYPNGDIIPYVQFKNTSATDTAVLKIAMASGDILDNRLVVSSVVTVQTAAPSLPVYTNDAEYTTASVNTLTFDQTGHIAYSVPVGSKKILIQNIGSSDIKVFENGFVVNPSGTFEINFAGSIDIYGTYRQSFVVGAFK